MTATQVNGTEEHVFLRWVHAAEAAAAPVLWQTAAAAAASGQPAAAEPAATPAAAGSLQQQMLADIAKQVANAYSMVHWLVNCESSKWKLLVQVESAALRVIAAAAAMLQNAAYGSSRRSSRFMPELLGSGSNILPLTIYTCRSVEDVAGSTAAAGGAVAASSSGSALSAAAATVTPGQSCVLVEVLTLTAAAAGGRPGCLPWMVLRLIFSQCKEADAMLAKEHTPGSQPRAASVCRVEETLSSGPRTTAQLISQLQLLLSRAVAALADQQQQQQQQDLHSPMNARSTTQRSSREVLGSKYHAGNPAMEELWNQQWPKMITRWVVSTPCQPLAWLC